MQMTEYYKKFKENWKSIPKLIHEYHITSYKVLDDGRYKNGRLKYKFIMDYQEDGVNKTEEREAMKLINRQYNSIYTVVKNPKPEICVD